MACLAITGVTTSALAGDLQANVARAVQQPAGQAPTLDRPIPKGYLWTGTALFVGGMAVALDGFLNNRNGQFPEFGEAQSTNIGKGAAGLATAFGGGLLLFLGKERARHAPSVSVESGRLAFSGKVRW